MSFRPKGGIPMVYDRTKRAFLSNISAIPHSVDAIRKDNLQLTNY